MARTRYLADTSAFAQLSKPAVAAAFAPLAAGGLVGLCPPVAFELGYAARSPDDYRALADRLSSFPPVPTTDSDHQRALEVQAALAAAASIGPSRSSTGWWPPSPRLATLWRCITTPTSSWSRTSRAKRRNG